MKMGVTVVHKFSSYYIDNETFADKPLPYYVLYNVIIRYVLNYECMGR